MSNSESSGSDGSGSSESREEIVEHTPRSKKRRHHRKAIGGSSTPGVATSSSKSNPFACPSEALKEFAKGPFDPKRPLLQFATKVKEGKTKVMGSSREWECNLCHKHYYGTYTRVYSHLIHIGGQGVKGCEKITMPQKLEATRLHMEGEALKAGSSIGSIQVDSSSRAHPSYGEESVSLLHSIPTSTSSGKGKGLKIKTERETDVAELYNIQAKDRAEASIGRFLFAHGIPFHVSRSSYYKQMCKDIYVAGPSYVPPGETKLRTTILDREYSKVNILMEGMKQTWFTDGCSIIMDGWTDIKHRPLINIIVTSTAGSYFLRAVDCSGKRKDAAFQFQILKDAIEEVGSANVVQVVTDSARVCKLAGLMIEGAYKHIFWTPCCVHALNNTLKDIGKIDWIKTVVAEARNVQMFVCNHHMSLALFRIFSKKEFLKPVETRYASYFILMERMLEVQESLQSMVVNAEWTRWHGSSTQEGKTVKQKILDDNWWATISHICSFIQPIVEVIRYADSDSPSLGEIYETFDSMLGKIRQVIRSKDPTMTFYEEHLRPIVTRRWNIMNTPLHMAAYAVNPKWYAPRPGRVDPSKDDEVKDGFFKALLKMYNGDDARKIRAQWIDFTNLRGPTFSRPEAKVDRETIAQKDPIGWWTWYGKDAPDLRTLAVRLLSQVASSSAAERNWSTYSFIHSVKRNNLTSRRAEKLVAVHSALRLQDRQSVPYRQTPALRWDVDPEDAQQIDEDDTPPGLVGVPLDENPIPTTIESEDDSDSDFDLDS